MVRLWETFSNCGQKGRRRVATHRAQAIVCPVVSNPPVKKTPASAAIRSSGRGWPASNMRVAMDHRCAEPEPRAHQAVSDGDCHRRVFKERAPMLT